MYHVIPFDTEGFATFSYCKINQPIKYSGKFDVIGM